ncbi:MAG: hypothetical protein AAF409_21680, partial [Pseudomonadota bacterium]
MTTTPTTWLDSFQVNTSSTNFQGLPDITGLSNGNFLVVFQDDSGTVGTGNGRDIVGVIYDAEGNIVETAFQVNVGRNFDEEELPSVAATSDGGFVMAYEDRDANGQSIYMERFDSSGTRTDQVTVQNDPGTEFVSNPKVAVNQANDSVFVSYQFSDGNNDTVRGKLFDSDLNVAAGTPVNGTILRADDAPSDFPGVFGNNTAALSNGNFVTVFSEPDNGTTGLENVEFRITNGVTGANLANVQVSTSGGDEDFNPDVAALTGGGFVVVWREIETLANGNDTGDNILFARYNSAGVLQGTITTHVEGLNENQDPAVIGLEDGGFFIAHLDNTNNTIEGTRYNDVGVRVGASSFAIESNITHSFPDIELSLTTDGRILVTYDDPSGDIQAEILDPRETTINADAGDGQITARIDEDS